MGEALNRDQGLLLALKLVRMLAYGQTTMILVPFFSTIRCSDEQIGLFMTLTLIGDVVLSTVITYYADNWGRRAMLIWSSVLMAIAGAAFTLSSNYWVLLLAAILGVISPSGDEVGPFRSIEESTLAHLTQFTERAQVYAWQNLLGTLGLAAGALSGGWLADWLTVRTGKRIDAYRIMFFSYSMLALVALGLSACLTTAVEPIDEAQRWNVNNHEEPLDEVPEPATPENNALPDDEESTNLLGTGSVLDESEPLLDRRKSRTTLSLGLCFLFGIDSLAYGFMPNSWLVEYMLRTFGDTATKIGRYFFAATVVSALTSLPSAWVTHAIGPVLAIGLTKIGAGIFGAAVPLAGSLSSAMGLVLLRSLFDTMDVVPRQVFITSVVAPTDRTRILGFVNVVKTLARAIGPIFTGVLAGRGHLAACFEVMGVLEGVFAAAIMAVFL